MPSDSKRMDTHVNRGLAWIGVASSLVGIFDLLAILIILNTWISAEEYGIATKCVWIFPILDQATDLGLSAAVIQRDDHSVSKISTVFWINMGLALLLFGLIAIFAPIVAVEFYGHAVIGWMLLVYGTKLIFQNLYFIPVAMMKRELRFKELSIIRIISNAAEFIGKIAFAWAGFGIWCFVLGPMCRVLITGIGAQICHPWRPKFIFRLKEAKEYVTFGLKTSGSQILYYFYTNVDYPIVGFFFGDTALGMYKMAYDIVLDPVRIISNVIVDIAFPAFARLRHTKDRLIAQFVSFTRLNLITVMSFSAIVIVAADDVISVLFPKFRTHVEHFAIDINGRTVDIFNHITGAEWSVRILGIVAVLRAVGYVVPPLLDGVGKPERTFTYTVTAAIAMPLAYYFGAQILGPTMGFESVPVAWVLGYPIAFAVLMFMATHTLGWSMGKYVRSVGGVILCMLGGGVTAALTHWLMGGVPGWIRLVAVTAVVVLVSSMLLAYTQGISLRSAKRALSAPADEVPPVVDDQTAT
ncbi:MAG: oligosaccharide flippase family protein [Deltaproteobacteria bacterium]|nr:oligosaccharide flippase family protein [Deltaproteobacteria bacterium]